MISYLDELFHLVRHALPHLEPGATIINYVFLASSESSYVSGEIVGVTAAPARVERASCVELAARLTGDARRDRAREERPS